MLRHPSAEWVDVPALPKAAQAVLEQRFVRSTSTLEACQRSQDGTTTKLLVRLQDGLQVEAVVMTYSHPGAPPSASPLQVYASSALASQLCNVPLTRVCLRPFPPAGPL